MSSAHPGEPAPEPTEVTFFPEEDDGTLPLAAWLRLVAGDEPVDLSAPQPSISPRPGPLATCDRRRTRRLGRRRDRLGHPRGLRLASHLPTEGEVMAPDHFFAEAGGALRRMENHGDLSTDRATLALRRVRSLRVHRVSTRGLLPVA